MGEEKWFLQTRGCAQLEAQEEASDASQERGEPIHERAMRLQSQASVQDRQGLADEEVEGDGELKRFYSELVGHTSGRGGRTHQVCFFRALYFRVARSRLHCAA